MLSHSDGPLIGWAGDEQMGSTNFQITVTLAMIASGILCVVLVGLPMLFLILIANFVMSLIGAVKAADGERYRYPFCLRLLR